MKCTQSIFILSEEGRNAAGCRTHVALQCLLVKHFACEGLFFFFAVRRRKAIADFKSPAKTRKELPASDGAALNIILYVSVFPPSHEMQSRISFMNIAGAVVFWVWIFYGAVCLCFCVKGSPK